MSLSLTSTMSGAVWLLLTLSLLTWRIWWAPTKARRWQMGFNSARKELNTMVVSQYDSEKQTFLNSLCPRLASWKATGAPAVWLLLTLSLLTWRIWWAPNNARRWQMGFNSARKGLNTTVVSQYDPEKQTFLNSLCPRLASWKATGAPRWCWHFSWN